MSTHRDLAIAAMKTATALAADDFMNQARVAMPVAIVPAVNGLGALPATMRETVPAEDLHRLVDVAMVWTIGDYLPQSDCSAYYDPSSPWYNVIYGAYGLRSYKRDGVAWGFNRDGTPNFAEFCEVSAIDYNFLTAGWLGCPPALMSFDVRHVLQGDVKGWACAEITATIPSGLHDFTATLGEPAAYVIYGIPDSRFLTGVHKPYEPVAMRGLVYMRQVAQTPQPITLAWGALCPDTRDGHDLMRRIVDAMAPDYFRP